MWPEHALGQCHTFEPQSPLPQKWGTSHTYLIGAWGSSVTKVKGLSDPACPVDAQPCQQIHPQGPRGSPVSLMKSVPTGTIQVISLRFHHCVCGRPCVDPTLQEQFIRWLPGCSWPRAPYFKVPHHPLLAELKSQGLVGPWELFCFFSPKTDETVSLFASSGYIKGTSTESRSPGAVTLVSHSGPAWGSGWEAAWGSQGRRASFFPSPPRTAQGLFEECK